MNGYNFTPDVRTALADAREEALRLRHEYIGTEHLLIGLIRGAEGPASTVLGNLHVDGNRVRERIEAVVKTGTSRTTRADLPFTSRAKKSIELAMFEARRMNHSYVGGEHLLLGLLLEGKGIAAQVLGEEGISIEQTRAETLRLLGAELRTDQEPSAALRPANDTLDRAAVIDALALRPHPEGGYYRELFRSETRVTGTGQERSAVTTIYYLLGEHEASKWHVVQADELWHHYGGGKLLLLDYDPNSKKLLQTRLGRASMTFVHAVPSGHWQAAIASDGTCLLGCTVAPGFEFADFQLIRDLAGHESAFTGIMSGFDHLL
jgi:predicted cupin superfamily sugar epimerase